jgi:pimeloyl-ACP methyl ester carboxylesterase
MSDPSREEQYWTAPKGRRLCFAEYGDLSGEPLMYFHGWPSSRLQGRILDAEAKRLGLRVISSDRPGLGRSDFAGKRTLAGWAEDISGLADHVGAESFRVLGVSGGGPYALACAAWLPERVRRVAIVCGAPPLADIPDHSDLLWAYRWLLRVRKRMPWLMEAVIIGARKISHLPVDRPPMKWLLQTIPEEDRRAVESAGGYELFFNSFREGVRQGGRGAVADADVYLDPWELDFSNIRVPVVFWHGGLDRNIPIRMAKELAARIPAAETRWFGDEGHYSLPLHRLREILEDLRGKPAETERD